MKLVIAGKGAEWHSIDVTPSEVSAEVITYVVGVCCLTFAHVRLIFTTEVSVVRQRNEQC